MSGRLKFLTVFCLVLAGFSAVGGIAAGSLAERTGDKFAIGVATFLMMQGVAAAMWSDWHSEVKSWVESRQALREKREAHAGDISLAVQVEGGELTEVEP